jgi:carbonic anhydrase/acetyltransferase-like protein (isoleucine patch superfamily)
MVLDSFERLTHWKTRQILRYLGVRGLVKSAYHSLGLTGDPADLLLHRNVIVEIESSAEARIGSRFSMGIQPMAASHPNLGKSKLTLEDGAVLETTGDSGLSIVGPCSVLTVQGGTFAIGTSFLNSHIRIICEDRIEIGDGCAIGWNVQFIDSDRHEIVVDGEQTPTTAPITVGDDVWIGHDVTVSKGVTIGEGAVVASNSAVVDDVPPDTLVAGVPATVVRENVEWE